MPTIAEIEALASRGEGLPASYTLPEQLLFLSLRALHGEYRREEVTRQQAIAEKARLVQQYEEATRWLAIYQQAVRIRNTMSWRFAAIEKDGCPLCWELIQIFDGRKQPDRKDGTPNDVEKIVASRSKSTGNGGQAL